MFEKTDYSNVVPMHKLIKVEESMMINRNIQHIHRLNVSIKILFLLSIFLCLPATALASEDQADLSEAWSLLSSKNYNEISRAADMIGESQHELAPVILSALLESQLYYKKSNKQFFIMQEIEDGYRFKSLIGDELIEQSRKRGFKKVKTNNRLRSHIRQTLASLQLNHNNTAVRLEAVKTLLKDADEDAATLIQPYLEKETDSDVKAVMQTLMAVVQLNSDNEKYQQQALSVLSESLAPAALNAIKEFSTDNPQLNKQQNKAIKKIEGKRKIYANIETVFFGLSLGSVLALSAIGLAITFGVMGVINMAHGELMMIGAYTTYVIQLLMPNHIGASILVAIPSAFVIAGLVGIAIERGVIKHLYGRPLETLLATFGISLVLQQLVRSIFSPLNRSVETPQWMADTWQINEVLGLTWNRLYIIIFCFLVFAALILIMKKSVLGLQVRAVSQNRMMARAMGVRSEWVDALTFGLGSGIAGMAGVALSLLTNVGPNLGQAYIIDSFMVVVFGGVGNLWGTLVAGMSLGVVNKLMEPWAGAVLAKILVLVFIILFIQKRPRGLFPQRGRAADD